MILLMSSSGDADDFPRLETKRLILRKLTTLDVEALFQLWNDNEVTQHMTIPSLTSVQQAEDAIQMFSLQFQRREIIRWGIFRKEDGVLLGTVGFNNWILKLGCRGEVGYELGSEYRGQGFMTEALEAVIAYGFQEMNLNRIEAMVVPGTFGSLKLLRKLGFQWEGILRERGYWKGCFWDEICLSLLRREWVKGHKNVQ